MAKRFFSRPDDDSAGDAAASPISGADETSARLGGPEPRVNKSEEIRVEAQRLLDRGEKPTPKAIIHALAGRGIAIVSPQASQVLKRMGIVGRPRRKKGGIHERAERLGRDAERPPHAAARFEPAERPTGKPASSRGASGEAFTLDDLIAAKQFAAMAGGPKRAIALLEALEKLA